MLPGVSFLFQGPRVVGKMATLTMMPWQCLIHQDSLCVPVISAPGAHSQRIRF